jgi:acyl-coenzyme A thioesterase PaaI-like protein
LTSVDFDPVEAARGVAALGGLEAMRLMIAGELPPPPIATLLGFDLVHVEEGRVVFAAEPGEQHSRGQAPYGLRR